MNRLLVNESPLQLLPTLASLIGLNEAIVLQQVHYWINNPEMGKTHEGARWIYNSVQKWQAENFPFWSEATIQRVFTSLRKSGFLLAKNLNETSYDRTLWYTIDYMHLIKVHPSILSTCDNGHKQNDKMDYSNLTQPIPETTQRIPKEHTKSIPQTPNHPQWSMPEQLKTPEFESAWIDWFKHRLDKGEMLTQTAGEYELKNLSELGHDRAVAAIQYSIRRGWKSIHEESTNGSTLPNSNKGWHPA